ncbi:MAG: hypothetical protein CSA85_00410 [Alphaproteobacteria bacterium]|nr:MAG: hypothetical protein CSA85_00410 [Alphaproteobacteria bacterium]
MALPLAPIAGFAIRYGAVALTTLAVARVLEPGRRDQRAEDALDDLPEGGTFRKAPGEYAATGRFKRLIRLGQNGPRFELDFAGLGRLRIRRK